MSTLVNYFVDFVWVVGFCVTAFLGLLAALLVGAFTIRKLFAQLKVAAEFTHFLSVRKDFTNYCLYRESIDVGQLTEDAEYWQQKYKDLLFSVDKSPKESPVAKSGPASTFLEATAAEHAADLRKFISQSKNQPH